MSAALDGDPSTPGELRGPCREHLGRAASCAAPQPEASCWPPTAPLRATPRRPPRGGPRAPGPSARASSDANRGPPARGPRGWRWALGRAWAAAGRPVGPAGGCIVGVRPRRGLRGGREAGGGLWWTADSRSASRRSTGRGRICGRGESGAGRCDGAYRLKKPAAWGTRAVGPPWSGGGEAVVPACLRTARSRGYGRARTRARFEVTPGTGTSSASCASPPGGATSVGCWGTGLRRCGFFVLGGGRFLCGFSQPSAIRLRERRRAAASRAAESGGLEHTRGHTPAGGRERDPDAQAKPTGAWPGRPPPISLYRPARGPVAGREERRRPPSSRGRRGPGPLPAQRPAPCRPLPARRCRQQPAPAPTEAPPSGTPARRRRWFSFSRRAVAVPVVGQQFAARSSHRRESPAGLAGGPLPVGASGCPFPAGGGLAARSFRGQLGCRAGPTTPCARGTRDQTLRLRPDEGRRRRRSSFRDHNSRRGCTHSKKGQGASAMTETSLLINRYPPAQGAADQEIGARSLRQLPVAIANFISCGAIDLSEHGWRGHRTPRACS
jgi:hypothetical protein